jgi:hypothetical protein
MRTRKTVLVTGILLLFGIFAAGMANAVSVGPAPDNMNEWVGKWFSYKVTQKGIAYDGSNFMTGSTRESGFFQVLSWDDAAEQFQIQVYFMDDGEWQTDTQTLNFYAGSYLNFLFFVENESEGYAFVALVKGKERNGGISGASIKSYGGIVLGEDDGEYRAGTMTLSAKMVDQSKVKVPPDIIILP